MADIVDKASKREEELREEALAKRVKYQGNFTHCKIFDCGVELPPERSDIGLCTDCAEEEEWLRSVQSARGPKVYDE